MLFAWITIFVIGLFLYFLPLFLLNKQYEGFENEETLDPSEYIKQLKNIFEPAAIGTPDFSTSPTYTLPNLSTSVPEPVLIPRSTPSTPNPTVETKTPAMEQGSSFLQTKPLPDIQKTATPVSKSVNPLVDLKPKPAPATEKVIIKYVEVPGKCPPQKQATCPPPPPPRKCPPPPPPRKCPPPPPQKKCPNMRDYIRKDSIPCWACKLS